MFMLVVAYTVLKSLAFGWFTSPKKFSRKIRTSESCQQIARLKGWPSPWLRQLQQAHSFTLALWSTPWCVAYAWRHRTCTETFPIYLPAYRQYLLLTHTQPYIPAQSPTSCCSLTSSPVVCSHPLCSSSTARAASCRACSRSCPSNSSRRAKPQPTTTLSSSGSSLPSTSLRPTTCTLRRVTRMPRSGWAKKPGLYYDASAPSLHCSALVTCCNYSNTVCVCETNWIAIMYNILGNQIFCDIILKCICEVIIFKSPADHW